MSQRHRQSRAEVPGYAKLPKEDRRLAHRRERQAARTALMADEPDSVLTPTAMHAGVEKRGSEASVGTTSGPRRFRHWKARFWKRRTTMRRLRNEALRDLNA